MNAAARVHGRMAESVWLLTLLPVSMSASMSLPMCVSMSLYLCLQGTVCVVNAAADEDLQVVCAALRRVSLVAA